MPIYIGPHRGEFDQHPIFDPREHPPDEAIYWLQEEDDIGCCLELQVNHSVLHLTCLIDQLSSGWK